MEFKYNVKRVNSFLGDCLVIKDTETGNSVELMEVQAKAIIYRHNDKVMEGVFPHAEYYIDGCDVHIHHNENKKKNSIVIDIRDLRGIVFNDIGVERANYFIGLKEVSELN